MITREDIMSHATICGISSAINLLLLAGYDGFDGTVDEYDTLMMNLEQAESEIKRLESEGIL